MVTFNVSERYHYLASVSNETYEQAERDLQEGLAMEEELTADEVLDFLWTNREGYEVDIGTSSYDGEIDNIEFERELTPLQKEHEFRDASYDEARGSK